MVAVVLAGVVVELEEVQEVVALDDQYYPMANNYDRRRMELFPIKRRFYVLKMIFATNRLNRK
jgi:hypothetical protein